MVVSNRHNTIEKAVRKVLLLAIHGVCTYHLKQNLKMRFSSAEVHKLFNDVAYTYCVVEFNVIIEQLQMISPRATTYIVDVGVDRWAHSHFSSNRYNNGVSDHVNLQTRSSTC